MKDEGIVAYYLAGHSLTETVQKFRRRRETISRILHADPTASAKLEANTRKRQVNLEATVCARSCVMKQSTAKIAKRTGVSERTVLNIRKRNPEMVKSLTEVQKELAESIGLLEYENRPVILGLFSQCWELMVERRNLDDMVKGARALQLLKTTYGVLPEPEEEIGDVKAHNELVELLKGALIAQGDEESA